MPLAFFSWEKILVSLLVIKIQLTPTKAFYLCILFTICQTNAALLESIKTTSMENVSTGVLEKIKNNI